MSEPGRPRGSFPTAASAAASRPPAPGPTTEHGLPLPGAARPCRGGEGRQAGNGQVTLPSSHLYLRARQAGHNGYPPRKVAPSPVQSGSAAAASSLSQSGREGGLLPSALRRRTPPPVYPGPALPLLFHPFSGLTPLRPRWARLGIAPRRRAAALPGSGNAQPVIQEADELARLPLRSGAAGTRGRGWGEAGGGGGRGRAAPAGPEAERSGPVPAQPPQRRRRRRRFHGAERAGEPGLRTPPAHGPRRGGGRRGGGQGEAPGDLHHGEQAHRHLWVRPRAPRRALTVGEGGGGRGGQGRAVMAVRSGEGGARPVAPPLRRAARGGVRRRCRRARGGESRGVLRGTGSAGTAGAGRGGRRAAGWEGRPGGGGGRPAVGGAGLRGWEARRLQGAVGGGCRLVTGFPLRLLPPFSPPFSGSGQTWVCLCMFVVNNKNECRAYRGLGEEIQIWQ